MGLPASLIKTNISFIAEIQVGLQYVFQTESPYVLLVSGSGHAGMEAVIANMLEPGETIVVGNHGIWGERVIDLSQRYGGMFFKGLTQNVPTFCLYLIL